MAGIAPDWIWGLYVETIMIFRTLVWAALAVAMLVGSLQSGLQQLQTVPIILAAEEFEGQKVKAPEPVNAVPDAHPNGVAHSHGDSEEEWTPADGLERHFWTWVANVLHAFSMSLLVLAVMSVCLWRRSALGSLPLAGLVAAAGWLCFYFWPSLGLPAEIPGMDAERLGSRQGWWALAAGSAALACTSLALMRGPSRFAVAVGLFALPFVVGAPHIVGDPLVGFTGDAKSALRELGREFILATAWLSLTFWASLGVVTSFAFKRWLRPVVQKLLSSSEAVREPSPEGQ